jgi:HSP20 family protein
MTLMRFTRPSGFRNRSPYDAINRFQEEVQRLFETPTTEFGSQFFNTWAPALDLYEDKDNLVVKLEVPGVKKDAFEIAIHDGVLSISGERRLEEKLQKASGYRAERFEGRFQRSVTLPKAVEVENVKAAYRDGVLTVTLPIAAQAKPKQIIVSAE